MTGNAYLSRDCPWCGVGITVPKDAVKTGVKNGDLISCPGCDEPFALAGSWETVEMDKNNFAYAGTT